MRLLQEFSAFLLVDLVRDGSAHMNRLSRDSDFVTLAGPELVSEKVSLLLSAALGV